MKITVAVAYVVGSSLGFAYGVFPVASPEPQSHGPLSESNTEHTTHEYLIQSECNSSFNPFANIVLKEPFREDGVCPMMIQGRRLQGGLALTPSPYSVCSAPDACLSPKNLEYPHFSDNPAISAKMRHIIKPFLLPLDHPMYPVLQSIFTKYSVIKNASSLRKAGFTIVHSQKKSFIKVLSHPELKGYLLKVYTDSERNIPHGHPGWRRFALRCSVAQKIKKIIVRHKIRHFVVADKWIYPLPPPSKHRSARQPVVLIVKDMNIYGGADSRRAWEKKATHRTLKELYTIFSRGYGSVYLAGNLPYTHNGMFAFIDTEYGKRRLNLYNMKKYFSNRLQGYWTSLVRHGSSRYVGHGLFRPAPIRFTHVE